MKSLEEKLQERVKELTALHQTARLLQDPKPALSEVMPQVVALLPDAWQFPDLAEGRICCGNECWSTPGFNDSEWNQSESFALRNGDQGFIEVVYRQECPPADEGPFLTEERELIHSLAKMLRAFFQHRRDDTVILEANLRLEQEVLDRTNSLRRLASEVCLAEERERRQIAEDLHDHLGQALAIMKMRLVRLRGDAVFGGHDSALDELVSLSDQAIRYTRGLTFELSPPVLYELGLGAALDWLGEQIETKHGLRVKVRDGDRLDLPTDLRVMLWKSARELLHNVIKHAQAKKIGVTLAQQDDMAVLTVADDGVGFDFSNTKRLTGDRFGLFSIEERLKQLGGGMKIETAPGKGASVRLTAQLREKHL